MIPLQLMPEPQNFDLNVRQKGALFLNKVPNPNYKDFVGKDYWRKAAKELYSSYRSICAYSCIYLPTSPGVVDHFYLKRNILNSPMNGVIIGYVWIDLISIKVILRIFVILLRLKSAGSFLTFQAV